MISPKVLTADEFRAVDLALERFVGLVGGGDNSVVTWAAERPGPTSASACLAVGLMLHAGLRVGEAVRVEWGQLIYQGEPVLVIDLRADQCKRCRARGVPASQRLRRIIAAAFHLAGLENGAVGKGSFVVSNNPALGVSPRSVQRWCEKFAAAVGVKPFIPHALRHTFASRLSRVATLSAVQAVLGHERLSTTGIYLHPTEDDLRAAVDKLDTGERGDRHVILSR